MAPRGNTLAIVVAVAALTSQLACAHDQLSTGTWVHDVEIRGTDEISARDIKKALATQKTGWWPFASKKWFDEAAFDLDLRRVTALYADRGFFDARVTKHDVKPHGKNGVDVLIEVQENSATYVREVSLRGFPAEVEPSARKDAERATVAAGQRFDYVAYTTLKRQLGDRLREKGYAYAQVDGRVDVDRDKHTAMIELDARAGPLVRFGATSVTGNDSIPEGKLLRRVAWNPGYVFAPRDVALTQGHLYDLGVFSSVKVDLPPEPTPTADVSIAVRPGKLHEVRAGGGVGAEQLHQEVRARFELTINNFLGGLRTLRLRVRPAYVVLPSVTNTRSSGPAAVNDVQLTQPDIFGSRIALHALLGYDVGIAEGYQNYGPRAQLGGDRPFFRDRLLAGASWNFQYLRFFNVAEDVFNNVSGRFYGYQDPYRLAYVAEFVQIDLRDRPLDPRYGGYLILNAEQGSSAVGGAFSYLKTSPDVRLYAPLGRRVVVAVRGLLGWMRPSGVGESPITRRFALGGPSSHRGFSFGRLAPQVVDNTGLRIPVGGDGAVLFSGDLRLDVAKIADAWLGVVPFFDAGDVTNRFGDLSLGNLHYATGVSLEYTTPIGIVRAGVGARLNRVEGDVPDPGQRFAYHITIGEAF